MFKKNLALCVAFSLLVAVSGAQTITIKMATSAPDNSPWANVLRALAADWEKISGGKIAVRLYIGMPGEEADILQKMRFGLDAGMLSTVALAGVAADVMALSIPGLLTDDASIEKSLAAVGPLLEQQLSKQGFVMLTLAKGGWLRIFSRKPIRSVADLKGQRFFVPSDGSYVAKVIQELGAVPVRTEGSAVIQRFATGTMDAIMYSPLQVSPQWSFFRPYLGAVSDIPVAPLFGAVVVARKTWERVPEDLKPALIAAAGSASRNMSKESDKYEEAGLASMARDGLVRPKFTRQDETEWRRAFAASSAKYAGEYFSRPILELLSAASSGGFSFAGGTGVSP